MESHGMRKGENRVWWEDPNSRWSTAVGMAGRMMMVERMSRELLRVRVTRGAVHQVMEVVMLAMVVMEGWWWWGVRGIDIPSCSGPTNSVTTVQQDGASSPISGDTWFPVVLAFKGRKGCTLVLEEIQWFLSQQAPQACGSRSHGISEGYLCMWAEKQSKTRFHHQDGRKCGQLSLSTEGGEAKMKGHWLLLTKRHRNCWFKG